MSTALVLSNQSLLVNIDYQVGIKDLYFPHIGMENQLNKYRNSFFIMIDGRYYLPGSDDVTIEIDYMPFTAIGKSTLTFKEQQVTITLTDFVLVDKNIYVRNYGITNNSLEKKEVRIFQQNNFSLSESLYADTTSWYQPSGALLHYKNNRYLAIFSSNSIYQFTCAAKSDNNNLGAYPDDKGELIYNIVATGNVNSCIAFKHEVLPQSNINGDIALAAGKSLAEVEKLINYYRHQDNEGLLKQTKEVWYKLLKTEDSQLKLSPTIPMSIQGKIRDKYWRSIIQIIAQIDKEGCVVAATDGQFLKNEGVDSYSYYWPRDGANVVLALNKLGQQKLARRCLNYSLKMTEGRGFFLHKYLPVTDSGKPALGSSWHGWVDYRGQEILPIQEDATAINIIAIADYFTTFKDKQFIISNWNYIEAIIKFLKSYNFKKFKSRTNISDYVTGFKFNNKSSFASKTCLPYPSFDIWEQYFGIFTHTAVLLLESIKKSIVLTDVVNAKYLKADLEAYYENLKKDILNYLHDKHLQKFIKGYIFSEKKLSVYKNDSADAALINAFNLVTDSEIKQLLKETILKDIKKLEVQTEIAGIARKEDDHYLHLDGEYNGNPWILTSLWMAEFAKQTSDTNAMLNYINWVIEHTDKTGLMPEQTNPFTGFALGVKPLTWNHAEFIRLLWS